MALKISMCRRFISLELPALATSRGRALVTLGLPEKLSEQACPQPQLIRSEEHTSELQSLMRISYAVFCLKKKKIQMQQSETRTRNSHYKRKKQRQQS